MDIFSLFLLLGGLGLFLFGMHIMSDGLEKAAGDRLRVILEKVTSNRILAVLLGLLVTCLIQSSSATTVMVVGFVNAGLMNLLQAVGVMMGANIGTTVTAQIIAFKIDSVAPLILFVGAIMYLFLKNRRVKKAGYIVLGFGLLFMGLSLMSQGIEPLKTSDSFRSLLLTFKNPVLGLIVGMLFTALIQSSSASVGVLQMFAMQGLVTLEDSAFIVLGMNIGTCITAVIASFSGGREGKRAAWANVIIKALGAVVYGVIVWVFPDLLKFIERLSPNDAARQIANFHLFYNLASTVLLLPFVPQLVKLVHKLIPVTEAEQKVTRKLIYLNKNILHSPSVAVAQAHRELTRMGSIAAENLHLALDSFFQRDMDKADLALETEETVDFLSHEITGYLVQMRGMDLPDSDLEKLSMMFHVVSDIERLSDHAENIAQYAQLEGEHKAEISPDALAELKDLSVKTVDLVELCLHIYDVNDVHRLSQVQDAEDVIDDLHDACVDHHVARLMQEKCDPRGGVVFTDMASDLERCADHATNIAYALLGEPYTWKTTADDDD
ncbi:MAG: Na/Pi cotransporter family protein [Eubacteriales bacterium]|nr:Na/Pi cotransporter family protein [Eubacteriales bacterium]